MLASAVAAAWSTYLYWLPCQGSMSSDECWRRMESGVVIPYPPEPAEQGPWVSELGVAAAVLLGVAWLALVLGLRWQLRTKAVAALPGLATLVVALVGAVAIGDASPRGDDLLAGWLLLGVEGSAWVALFAIVAWQLEISGRVVLRLVVVLWGITAFGAIHVFADYLAMIIFSGAFWEQNGFPDETPAGTGYLTVATITISAILTVIMTLRAPKRAADAEPPVDPRAGSLTLA
jgi:hypothetical protein